MKKRTVIAGILALAGIICAGVAGYQYYQDRHAGKEYEDLKEKVVKEKQEEIGRASCRERVYVLV